MRVILVVLILVFSNLCGFGEKLSGEVSKQGELERNTVVEHETGAGVGNARVSVPAQNFDTVTDQTGGFNIPASMMPPYIMSVKKDGYKPFSMTVTEKALAAPLLLQIEKSDAKTVVVEAQMCHLGDNDYSDNSANAGDFRIRSSGPIFRKNFAISNAMSKQKLFLRIGSIIGIDTKEAVKIGQSHVRYSYSSPVKIFVNSKKIGEIKINGDNQKLRIPKRFIRPGELNEVRIETSINLFQHAYTDYDDMEFMNVFIES